MRADLVKLLGISRINKCAIIGAYFAALAPSLASDPEIELWERKLALLEKRQAYALQELKQIDKRAISDAENFLREVNNAQDDKAVMELAIKYPRAVINDQANEAYKQALSQVEEGMSPEAKIALAQSLGRTINQNIEKDRADRAEFLAELESIKMDSNAQAQQRKQFFDRNQASRDQQQMAREVRALRQEFESSNDRRMSGLDAESSRPTVQHAAPITPALPRHMSKHDSAGNLHNGIVHPTGFYHGNVISPSGEVGDVTGHVSPHGSFQGTDNNGGLYYGQ